MITPNRRTFLKIAATGMAGTALSKASSVARAAGANDRLVIGVIGCGNQGGRHARSVARMPGVTLAYVCDPDDSRVQETAKATGGPKAIKDLRAILDDRAVDGVIIATPDHWHTPTALLAMEAGKHVYVEKPCSHNVREGQLLVEAVKRYKRVFQHGTQSHSNRGAIEAMQMLREGIIGDVLAAKAWNVQRRQNIGHELPTTPPAGFDYDLWVGPAEVVPFRKNCHHYSWHWWYNFGTGDMGNDGTHEVDYARWALEVDTHPSRVTSVGDKLFFEDDQQFPDTMQVVFEYPGDGKVGGRRMLVFEQRLWSPAQPYDAENGAEFYGTKGTLFFSKHGGFKVVGPGNKPLDVKINWGQGNSCDVHQQNWMDCIRSGARPNSDVQDAHQTGVLIHLANIGARLGRRLRFDPATERCIGDDDANAMLSRKYRAGGHWAVPTS
ncbi:MAG TPA: Gfo/Idh/MocA family oxidoreductase [Phycisphaerae bacterium]|nr:Gfo/Idh/MocA family oxidoreductase [Phycisphaerae bacterium]HRY70039.1 Gfo/Idh/MocA family oxidoreductase [Phycisphaerae bacterium]HSA27315.1 Gfo/Idh/MocA family oxidoreductase [Phycisphaerae bacterium]